MAMDSLLAMRLFTRIVECRSFTHAAQELGVPRSTATQGLKDLEARLGVRLLQRTTRAVTPTLDGQAFHRRCLSILADIEEAEGAFTGARPRGLIRVDMPGRLARHFVLPGLPAFLARHPEIRLHLGEGDRLVDLVREGYDCVVRVGALPDSALVGRRLAALEEGTYASPGYLRDHGVPRHPDALEGHRMIGYVSSAIGQPMPLEFRVDGEERRVTLPSLVTVSGTENYAALVRLGLGLIQVPRYRVAEDLAAGALVEVLEAFAPTPTPVHILYPDRHLLSPRVRVFADWLAERFRDGAG